MDKSKIYAYLLKRQLSESVIQQHIRHAEYFMEWCKSENLDYERIQYRELLGYVKHLKTKKYHTHTLNIKVNSISKYCDYLIEEGVREDNPAKNLRIKGATKKVMKNILTHEQLEELYIKYSSKTDHYHPLYRFYHQRNLVILGMIIYQAVHNGELTRMEAKDINLGEGTVYVPGTGGSNGRTLKLHASQVMPINNYLTVVRPILTPKADELIPGRVYSIVAHMNKELRKYNPQIKNALHIRSSVIMQWIKLYNIRQAQYMCGHRSISSTESYKEQDLEGMQNQLIKYHPFS